MACAALVQIGPARQTLLGAVHAATGALRERTRLLPRARRELVHARSATAVAAAGEADAARACCGSPTAACVLELMLEEEPRVQALLPARRARRAGRASRPASRAHGTLALDGGPPRRGRGARGDRRHRRATTRASPSGAGAPASAWRADGTPARVEPGRGRQRPAAAAPSARCGSTATRARSPPVELRRRPAHDRAATTARELRFTPEAERAAARTCCSSLSDYRAPFGTLRRHAARAASSSRTGSA